MRRTGPVDTKRCVIHIDVDAFYAQCEEIRNPALKERPLGQCCDLLLAAKPFCVRLYTCIDCRDHTEVSSSHIKLSSQKLWGDEADGHH